MTSLFLAPMPCSARNRDGTLCRHNASGLLRGCWLEQHKWQNAKMLLRRQSWARFGGSVIRSIHSSLVTLAALGGFASGMAAVVTLLLD